MRKPFVILVGYDGSPCADAALDDLGRAGLPRHAETLILSVSEVWLPGPSTVEVPASHSSTKAAPNGKALSRASAGSAVAPAPDTRTIGAEAKARLQAHFPDWQISVEQVFGSPARELLKKAEDLKPDLIVVGSQGRSALGRFLLGSVSLKVVNEAHCTVRVCRGIPWKNGSPVRILIGLDGSPSSELAVNAVAGRAWPSGSAVRLITALDPDGSINAHLVTRLKNSSTQKGKPKRSWVESFLRSAQERMAATHLDVSTRIEEGDPKRLLIADAEEWGADCIFLGASGSNNVMQKFLLGSVATAIVARAHCSVEVVRSGYR